MGQALYRSYRSKSFDEIVGQEHITKTLQTAIKKGRLSHAYLFSGPRGVGKTSVARILAHEVNKLPYTGEEVHLDIIEIDAASNRRIDEIRNLRDKVHITPTSAKYKVYIIDEVHMLTKEAFNALLKTLEEPPEHCIFILATTESHKLPETIISRTQHFNFKAAEPKQASDHLESIAKKEKIDIDREALELIAQHSGGSFRDSISLLDQLSSLGKHITASDVRLHFGLPQASSISKLLEAVDNCDPAGVLKTLNEMNEVATDPLAIAKSLSEEIRGRVAANNAHQADFTLLRELVNLPASPQPSESLEILLLEASTAPGTSAPAKPKSEPTDQPETSKMEPKKTIEEVSPPEDQKIEVEEAVSIQKDEDKQTGTNSGGNFELSQWDAVIEDIKGHAASLYTALRLASPSLEDGRLKLSFEFPLHQKKVNQAANKELIGKSIEKLSGAKVGIECVVDKNINANNQEDTDFYKSAPADDGSVKVISNIFGSAEVLES